MTLLEKIFGSAILAAFEQEILTAQVGKSVLGGHAKVVDVAEHSVTVELTFSNGIDYTIKFERKAV